MCRVCREQWTLSGRRLLTLSCFTQLHYALINPNTRCALRVHWNYWQNFSYCLVLLRSASYYYFLFEFSSVQLLSFSNVQFMTILYSDNSLLKRGFHPTHATDVSDVTQRTQLTERTERPLILSLCFGRWVNCVLFLRSLLLLRTFLHSLGTLRALDGNTVWVCGKPSRYSI